MESRRLKGHKATATCCIAPRTNPSLCASSGEDGYICGFDLRCKDPVFVINVANEPVTSLCFKAGNEDILYASSGTNVSGFDIKMVTSSKRLETYNFNNEEINQIDFTPKSYFLAAADDSGDVKIIDTRQQSLYKTLRAVHSSICSSVKFLSWKPWTVVTGGLDSKLVTWDFSKGRSCNIINYGTSDADSSSSAGTSGQCFNPAFVHSIAVPEEDTPIGLCKVCAIAMGDGIVNVIDMEHVLTAMKPRNSSHPRRHSQSERSNATLQNREKKVQLDYTLGGHTASVSCVSFPLFGEKGKLLISGGNDASVKLWNWSKYFQAEETTSSDALVLNIKLKRKVNWLCTTTANSDNLIICDTSKVLKVYSIPE